MGDPGNNDGPPWGRTWNATNSDPEEVFLGHVIEIHIYIYIHIFFLKREGKNSSTSGKWVVWGWVIWDFRLTP